MGDRRIYLAASSHTPGYYAALVQLRGAGHACFDFLNPEPGTLGFAWDDVDTRWSEWTPAVYAGLIHGSIPAAGFALDKAAMDWADTCILLLPASPSAHLAAGYMIGRGKPTFIVLDEFGFEPALMHLLSDGIHTSVQEVIEAMGCLPEVYTSGGTTAAQASPEAARAAERPETSLARRPAPPPRPAPTGSSINAEHGELGMDALKRHLMAYVAEGGRVAPRDWHAFSAYLSGFRTGPDDRPPVPLILAAADEPDSAKRRRLREQIEWAATRQCLMEVDEVLRALSEADWQHDRSSEAAPLDER